MSARRLVTVAAAAVASVLLLVGPAALAATPAPPADKLLIRKIDARDRQNVKVSLVYNGPRADLEKLTVRENGQQVESSQAQPLRKAGVSVALVLVVDTSGSMGENGGLRAAKEGLADIIRDKAANDSIAIVGFDDEVHVYTEPTTSEAQAMAALDQITAKKLGQTAMWDGVTKASALLEDMEKSGTDIQPNLVLVTDGTDDVSTATAGGARGAAARSGAVVFAMGIHQADELDQAGLNALVARTGGQVFDANSAADVSAAFRQVRTSLDNQFIVTYPSNTDQGSIDLQVTVNNSTANASFVAGSVSQGAAAQPQAVPKPWGPAFLHSPLIKFLGLLVVGLAVGLAAYALALLVGNDDSALDNVLMPYSDGWTPGQETEGDQALAQTALLQRAVEFTEDFAQKQGMLTKVEFLLERADLPLRAAEALFFYLVAVVIVSVMGLLLGSIFGLIVAFALSALLPPAAVNIVASMRRKKFNSQLPDMLQLLAGSLRAGYSLMQGIEAVSQEVTEPMGKELRRVVTEARLGRELEDSLEGVAERLESPDFAWAVMAIRIQREVGGNLSELLMTVSETMIARERMRREVAALTAEGKMSAYMIGALPPILGLVMYTVNAEYMKPLFTETFGHIMLGAALVMTAVGFLWMKKTITIKL